MTLSDASADEVLRHRALHSALAAMGSMGQVLLRAHPEAAAIPAARVLEPLEWIQWDELELRQRRLDVVGGVEGLERSPETYLVERRQLEHWSAWRVAASRMPATWRRVLHLSAKDAQGLMARIGLELAARAASGIEGAALEAWLAPLGGERAREVAALLIERRSKPRRALAQAAKSLIEDELAHGAKGERLLVRSGRRALAASLARVPEDVRLSAARSAWSNLLAVLERTLPLVLQGEADERALEELVAQALSGLGGGES